MSTSQTFTGVSAEVWERMKALGRDRHGTVYAPEESTTGTATTRTLIGSVVLAYQFDPAQETVTYTIESKPFLVMPSQIWDGISGAVTACQKEA